MKELTNEEVKVLTSKVDELFGSLDLKGVSSESVGFEDMPDGYYLSKVRSAELTTSKSGNPQVAFSFKVVEDGIDSQFDESTGTFTQTKIKGTKGRVFFKYYTLRDTKDAKKFVSDMMKFQVNDKGESLPADAFMNANTINEALAILVDLAVYVNLSSSVNEDGAKSTWYNLISWKRAEQLELPIE